ncbi:MAG: hypothetical protein ACTSU5_19860 [Promethearchaeota archaeon]
MSANGDELGKPVETGRGGGGIERRAAVCWNCGCALPEPDPATNTSKGTCSECGVPLDPNDEIPWTRSLGCFCATFIMVVVIISLIISQT